MLAYASSLVSTSVGFPLDTVKTRMQTYKSFTSIGNCVAMTFRHEGVRGFFRGIWAPLLSTSCLRSLNVSIFTAAKPYCYDLFYGWRPTAAEKGNPFIQNLPVCFAAGLLAGIGVSAFACPFEFTKLYSQIAALAHKNMAPSGSSTPSPKVTTWGTVKNIVRHEGLLGLYSGYKYQFLRDALGAGVYFAVYESFKWAANALINPDPAQSSPFSVALAGGMSGVACWVAIFPLDTTKSLIQRDIVTNILRKDQNLDPLPPKNRNLVFSTRIYRGLGVQMMRSFLVSMVFFSNYELLMKYIN